ncbi:helix-turn-helix domain-containing protein [Flagellimonas nanhaiensis]|uniref:AraC family transcriptional regulator n=1 Tax=Flagellimonas nanhaiensis TaxID=2292706 RepID=A0A371JSY1_9FLAO|nr:helix-turn-helix domain-containing protein [Allomuricauda nanhaiensis]RDY60907.1 AraC family transcriptional regulator [Allomuricauda nanhaiensis]
MRTSGFLVFLLFVMSVFCHARTIPIDPESLGNSFSAVEKDSLDWAEYYYNIHRYKKAIPLYKKNLDNPKTDQLHILKKLALSEAALENTSESISNVSEYLKSEFNPNFLLNEGFDPIRETPQFKMMSSKLIPRVTTWSVVYLFVALIGFYVVFLISLNRQINPSSRVLIAIFIFIHSFFILNISISSANYMFEYPHTYLMSTWASFLYGPLLFFYFKKTTQKYNFKRVDLLHLLPTIVLSAYLAVTIYSIPFEGKRDLMLSRILNGLNPQDSDKLILLVFLKIASLTIYGYFIWRVYYKSKKKKLLQGKNQIWQKNIYYIHIFYVLTYSAYGIIIINGLTTGFLFHIPVIAMATMVLYVGYSANIQPDVFNGAYAYTNRLFPKYEKSGLTPSLSIELKENLLHLFANEKIYKENNINLDMVAKRLNTTRHNASQIINEHFNVSFHELVNTYRIKEAKELLLDDKSQRLNIINIAYEVGYNNKVTFNKAFKKDTQLTPSQYQRNIMRL